MGPPARDAVAVAERLLAIQGQDPRGARLAVRARTSGLTAADVDRALDERELLITWLNRGTLHLVRREDYPWLHAVTTPQLLTGSARRLAQEGVTDPDRGVAVVEKALADGPKTRAELRERLDAAGVATAGQALVHVLLLASIRGLAVRGPMVGREHAYVLVRDWLGEQKPVDREAALAELARRYLAGHAPADEHDLAKWAGITLRDARAGFAGIGERPPERTRGAAVPPPRLLGPFDPLLHGWASREAIVGPHRHLVTDNGLFRPFALVGGRAVATWKLAGGKVVLAPLERISRADRAALDAEAADVERFLRC